MNTNDDALSVVHAHPDGWTTRNFEQVAKVPAPHLKIETPINEYPTTKLWIRVLSRFGQLVTHVNLLAEFSNGGEAMLLFDMDVDRLGRMRVAEHFTGAHGKITRIGEIHETVAARAAGLAAS